MQRSVCKTEKNNGKLKCCGFESRSGAGQIPNLWPDLELSFRVQVKIRNESRTDLKLKKIRKIIVMTLFKLSIKNAIYFT